MNWTVSPAAAALRGVIEVPGDKSISHRLALLTGLAGGVSRIEGFLMSDDCLRTLDAMEAMGVGVERSGTTVTIHGRGGTLRSPVRDLDMGNSGTAMRLMTGLLSGLPLEARLVGDASLSSRPMNRILVPLAAMGAEIAAEGEGGRAPLAIRGGTLTGVEYAMPVASAQVKSCLLLAGMRAGGTTTVISPAPSRDHTERLMQAMGLDVVAESDTVRIRGTGGKLPALAARDWQVPGDISSAAFWLVAGAILPGAEITVRNVGLNPSRTALLEVLREMGADFEIGCVRNAEWEPQADITVRGSRLRGVEIGGQSIPNLIDEIPIICVAAAYAQGATRVRDAAELRVKESDRIESTAAMLRATGIEVQDFADGLAVMGRGGQPSGGEVDSFGDHRLAMAGAILALGATAPVAVRDVECVGASYPGFFADLQRLLQ